MRGSQERPSNLVPEWEGGECCGCLDPRRLQTLCQGCLPRRSWPYSGNGADLKVQALWSALLLFPLLPTGFSNRDLRCHLAPLMGLDPNEVTPGQMTYQLRRLRLHGIIERIPRTHRYHITDFGSRIALFFTRTYTRILRPGLAKALPEIPCANTSLRRCFDKLQQEINTCVNAANPAA